MPGPASDRTASPPRRLSLPVEIALIASAWLAYFGIRALTQGSEDTALAHAHEIMRFEDWLGIDAEADAQGTVAAHRWLLDLGNWIYIWGHWPVIAVTAVLLFRHRQAAYRRLRNAMFVSGGIGLVHLRRLPGRAAAAGRLRARRHGHRLLALLPGPAAAGADQHLRRRCPACTSAGTCSSASPWRWRRGTSPCACRRHDAGADGLRRHRHGQPLRRRHRGRRRARAGRAGGRAAARAAGAGSRRPTSRRRPARTVVHLPSLRH